MELGLAELALSLLLLILVTIALICISSPARRAPTLLRVRRDQKPGV